MLLGGAAKLEPLRAKSSQRLLPNARARPLHQSLLEPNSVMRDRDSSLAFLGAAQGGLNPLSSNSLCTCETELTKTSSAPVKPL